MTLCDFTKIVLVLLVLLENTATLVKPTVGFVGNVGGLAKRVFQGQNQHLTAPRLAILGGCQF